MKDEIIGTAVLDTSGSVSWLYYVRTVAKVNGDLSCDELPVMQADGPAPAQQLPSWFPENKPWKYRISGDTLHVSPSVLIKDFFHNEGQWTVKFVQATGKTRMDHYRQLIDVNPTLGLAADLDRRLGGEE